MRWLLFNAVVLVTGAAITVARPDAYLIGFDVWILFQLASAVAGHRNRERLAILLLVAAYLGRAAFFAAFAEFCLSRSDSGAAIAIAGLFALFAILPLLIAVLVSRELIAKRSTSAHPAQ